MQVVDDGKETKLKKFEGADVPEQEVQDNSEVEEVIDDTQVVHEEQKTESTPTQPEAESEEQISGDQLSELLDLIDRTIEGRDNAIERQAFNQKSSIKPTKSSTGECLDVSPNYFADGVLKTNRPSQLSERSEAESDEKGWWQRMRERRKNREEENNP